MSKEIDEILDKLEPLYGGVDNFNDRGEWQEDKIKAKQAIQELINKARIEVWERVDQLSRPTKEGDK